jgi:hypothetical protein
MSQKIFDRIFGGDKFIQIIAKDNEFQIMLGVSERNLYMDKDLEK